MDPAIPKNRQMIYRIVFVGNTGKHNRPGSRSTIFTEKEPKRVRVLGELCRAIVASFGD